MDAVKYDSHPYATLISRVGERIHNQVRRFAPSSVEPKASRAKAPFGPKRFCLASTCYSTDEKNEENKRRLDEMRLLLEREGL